MKKEISKKKDTHKAMCRYSSEENRNRQQSMKNKAKKAARKAVRKKVEKRSLLS